MLGGVGACGRAFRLGFALALACGAFAARPAAVLAAALHAAPAPRAVFLSEDFELTFPPAGWGEVETAPDPYNWQQTADPAYVFAGTGAALVRWTNSHDQDESLTTPAVDLGWAVPADLYLSFWWRGTVFYADAADLEVYASADSTAWSLLWRMSDVESASRAPIPPPRSLAAPLDPWRQAVISVAAYAGGDLYVRFRYHGRNGDDVALDDVLVGTPEPPQPPPNDDCAGAIAAGYVLAGDSVAVEFTLDGNNNLATADYPLASGGSCTGYSHSGRDVVWVVDLEEGEALDATMTTVGGWDDTIFLITDCADPQGTCVAGDNQIPDGSTIHYVHTDPLPGRYFLIVSAYAEGVGSFRVEGAISPPVAVAPATWGRIKSRYRGEGEWR